MKKAIALFLAMVLALGMVACGAKPAEEPKEPETETEAPAEVPEETPEEAPEEAPEEEAAPAEAKHVVYWSMWNENEPQGAAVRDAAKAFNELNEGRIEVEVVFQGRGISQVLVSALEAGNQVDIFDSPSASLAYGKEGYVLNDLVKEVYPTTNGKPYEEAVNGALLDLLRSQNETGDLVSIPYLPFCLCICYNADHFADAGIDKIPETWEELMDACEKLVAKGYVPFTTDDAYCDTLPGMYMARAKGSDWIMDHMINNTYAEIAADPMFLQMAKAFEEMTQKGYIHENAWANVYPTGQQDLATGIVTMYLNGTWLPNEIKATTGPDFNWGMMAFPTVPGGVAPATETNVGAQEFMINKRTEVAHEAFEFIVFLTTGEWDEKLAGDSMQAPVGDGSKWPVQLASAEPIFSNVSKNIPWSGGINANVDYAPRIQSAFKSLIGGQMTAEEFVAELAK